MGSFSKGALTKQLEEFKRRGSAQGAKNLPPPNAPGPDANETAIISDARSYIGETVNSHLANLTNVERQANNYTNDIDSVNAACRAEIEQNTIESSFNAILSNHRTGLVSAQEEELIARAQLEGFKHQHGIQRPAKYPKDNLHHFSMLILFVAIETVVNAVFYEGERGLIGGAVVALSVSIVNMGMAVFFGMFFRYAHLNDSKQQVIGYSSMLGFIVLSIVLNLIFATFRVQHALLADSSSTEQLMKAFRISVTDAFGVFALHFPRVDFMSFILFFVGVGCCVIGFYKGYMIDDPCPGYGELDRKYKTVKSDFEAKRTAAINDLTHSMSQKIREIETLLGKVLDLQRRISALKAEALNSDADYKTNIETIQNELDTVIKTYRDSNIAVRSLSQPGYFKERVVVLPESDYSEKLNVLIEKIKDVTSQAKQMQDYHSKPLNDIKIERQRAITELQANWIPKFFLDILSTAETNISRKLHK